MSTRTSSFLLAMTGEVLSALTSDLILALFKVSFSSQSHCPPLVLFAHEGMLTTLIPEPQRITRAATTRPCSDGHTQASYCSQGPCRCVQLEGRGGPALENIILQRMPQGLCQEYQPQMIGAGSREGNHHASWDQAKPSSDRI